MGAIEPWHLIVLLVIVLIVVGPSRLPEVGKGLGQAMREFRHATTELRDAVRPDEAATPPTPPAPSGPATAPAPARPDDDPARRSGG